MILSRFLDWLIGGFAGLACLALFAYLSGVITRVMIDKFGPWRVLVDGLVFIGVVSGGAYLLVLYSKFKHGG